MRSTLVVAQLALSVVLLVGALLLGQSFSHLVNAETGFDMENLFYAPIGLPESRYASESQRTAFVDRLVAQIGEVPGIAAVGVSDSAVSAGGGPTRRIELASRRGVAQSQRPEVRWTAGSPGYIQALGLKLIAGRYLEPADDARGRRVALVSQSFVRALLGTSGNAVGERIVLDGGAEVEIVGVVQDVKQIGMNITQRPQVYVPYAQQPSPFMQLVARTSVAPLSIGPSVRAQIDQLDPLIPVLRLTTALRERALAVWTIGLFASIFGLVGAVGLTMATVGVYGVVRYATQQRTREFGIRSALGAEPRNLVLLVMRQTWLLTGIGLALGLALSSVLGTVLRALLYEVDAFQPASLALPALLLGASSVIAGALPAARAARVDPMVVLSAE
jgi:putative ABC transport system permease protein